MDTRSRILITGAGGMLGRTFRAAFNVPATLCLSRHQLDTAHALSLRDTIRDLAPNFVLNCAADTNVDGAETDPDPAYWANILLPGLLAQACRAVGATLIHFSSTGCYGHDKTLPFTDFDAVNPTTAHHRSKAAGEDAVRQAGGEHLILRLGWLYGDDPAQRRNFVLARIREARLHPDMTADPFQTGNPTHVEDVVRQTSVLVDSQLRGTFNCVANGSVSRYDYVRAIVAAAGLDARLLPRRFVRQAPVSPNEAAINLKLDLLGLNMMPPWESALIGYVGKLLQHETGAVT